FFGKRDFAELIDEEAGAVEVDRAHSERKQQDAAEGERSAQGVRHGSVEELGGLADSADEGVGSGDRCGHAFGGGGAEVVADLLCVLAHRADLESGGEASEHVVDKVELLRAGDAHAGEETQVGIIFAAEEIERMEEYRRGD